MKKLGAFLISERTVVTVILINTVVMTLSGFCDDGSREKTLLERIDYGCVVFFVLEAALKIGRHGWRGYWSVGWNRFDLLVTVLCLPVLFGPFLDTTHQLGWLPIFRTGRLFRLFRVLRFIPDVDRLVSGIRRALRASVGVFLALLMINLILALAATYIFGKEDPERFGNPASSFYSIFRIFTVEGWNEFPDDLEGKTSDEDASADGGTQAHEPPWGRVGWSTLGIRLFFMFTVLVGGMLGLSLANAVFVDEMTMDNTRELESKVDALTDEVRTLRKLLQDGTGRHGS
ncbi:MAG: ion transporter [bacterium]|nr:ion transporter [bacterium]